MGFESFGGQCAVFRSAAWIKYACSNRKLCVCVMRHCNHRWRFHLLTTVLHTDLIATVMHIKKENHQRSLNFSSPINIHIFMNAPRPDAMHTNTDMESQKCCGENGFILVVFELRAQFVQVLMKTAVKKACLWNWNWHHLLVDVRQHDRLMSERQKFKLMMLLNCRFEIDIERARKKHVKLWQRFRFKRSASIYFNREMTNQSEPNNKSMHVRYFHFKKKKQYTC